MSQKDPQPSELVVAMQDGRLVTFAGKRKLLKSSAVGPNGELQTRLDFRNGETRLFTIPEQLTNNFALHGAEQKLGDSTAGLESVDDMVLAVDDLIEQLYNGEWSARRESSGMAGASVLLRAMVEFTGKPVDSIKAVLKEMTAAEKNALRASPKIKPIIERLEAEKAAKGGVDAEVLLGKFEA